MNRRQIYYFTIKAESSVYFGGNNRGELIKDACEEPFVSGNSIGGALRDYLICSEVSPADVQAYMGGADSISTKLEEPHNGQEESKASGFKESRIFISDGKVTIKKGLVKTEGTAIDPAYGTAKSNHKYEMEYLPQGTQVAFRIECDTANGQPSGADESSIEFKQLIDSWARGIDEGKIRFGGKKSNGFGKFSLVSLELADFKFDSEQSLDEYIFSRHLSKRRPVSIQSFAINKHAGSRGISFSLNGSFPYGVYQSFTDFELTKVNKVGVTGLQKNEKGYFIPASSLKGVLRNEIRLLLIRMTGSSERADSKCETLFGSVAQQGKLVCSDMYIKDANSVSIDRFGNSRGGLPVYIKIDRLTGGAFSSALKHQNEIHGDTEIQIELLADAEQPSDSPYLFPLVYALRRVGSGKVPLGGRTVIGLGEFDAATTIVAGKGWEYEFANQDALSVESTQFLRQCFETFERWCLQ